MKSREKNIFPNSGLGIDTIDIHIDLPTLNFRLHDNFDKSPIQITLAGSTGMLVPPLVWTVPP